MPPEKIPPAEHIKEVEKRFKNTTPKLELGEREAGGLLGDTSKKLRRTQNDRTNNYLSKLQNRN